MADVSLNDYLKLVIQYGPEAGLDHFLAMGGNLNAWGGSRQAAIDEATNWLASHGGPSGATADLQQKDPNNNYGAYLAERQKTAGAAAGAPSGPNAELATADPNKYKLMQMHLAALANQAYRPEMAGARTNALQSQLSAYEPMNNVLGAMYGPSGKVDLARAAQSPMSAAMMRLGAPNQNDIGIAPPGSPNAAGYIQGPKGIPASAAAPTSYPDASLTIGPPPLRRGPDGKLYDAQGRPVPG